MGGSTEGPTASKAVVVGGGIGGLATALGLERAGWQVTLLERAEAFRPVGAGLALAPNAVRALDWLGLGEALRSRGAVQGSAGIRTSSGRWLLRENLAEMRRRFGVPGFALHRGDVHGMLTSALRHTDIRTGHRAIGLHADTSAATVTFDGPAGTGSATADLVVAADGAHSQLRTALFPDHPGLTYAGYVAWRGVVPAEAASGIELGDALSESWGRAQRFGIVPLPDGRVYWFATASTSPGAHTHDTVADLGVRFRDWHDPIPQLLAATPPEALLRHDIYSLDAPLPSYVSGRVAMLGDAAHAITPDLGQGACLALEDAITLTALIAQAQDHHAGLRAYDRARRPRTQRLVRISALAGRVAQWHHPVAVAVRNGLARLTPTNLYLRAISDTLSWAPDPAWPHPPARHH